MKYIYTGDVNKYYIDCTGHRFFLMPGAVFEPKEKPDWDTIEEHKKHIAKIKRRFKK